MRTLIAALLITLAASACASAGGGGATRDRSILTVDELRGSSAMTAYEIIERQRPEWLRSRGATSLTLSGGELPIVYINNSRHGAIDTLRSLPTADLVEIRYYSGPEATQRWGTGVAGGVIAVRTR